MVSAGDWAPGLPTNSGLHREYQSLPVAVCELLTCPGWRCHRDLSLDQREKTEPHLWSFSQETVHWTKDFTQT